MTLTSNTCEHIVVNVPCKSISPMAVPGITNVVGSLYKHEPNRKKMQCNTNKIPIQYQ